MKDTKKDLFAQARNRVKEIKNRNHKIRKKKMAA
jgi:hypothetical protein